jgi:uncharacterized membrane protein
MDWTPLIEAGPLVQGHIIAAVVSALVGAAQFVGRKGSSVHKTLGWVWIGLIAITAGTSIFMRNLNDGGFSMTHGFTALAALGVPAAVIAIRRGDVLLHRNFMIAVYVGGLLIAGAFTLTPGRLLHDVLFAGEAAPPKAR